MLSDGGRPIRESDDIHLPTEALVPRPPASLPGGDRGSPEAIPLDDLGQVRGHGSRDPGKAQAGSGSSSSGAAELKQTPEKTAFRDSRVRPPPNTPTADNAASAKRSKLPAASKSAPKGPKCSHGKHGAKASRKPGDVDLSSSDSNEETPRSKSCHGRTLRKTRSRGKGKGDRDLGVEGLGVDNQGYASEGEKGAAKAGRPKAGHARRSRSSGRPKECWS